MDAINTYVARYKANTPFEFEIVRRQSKRSDPMRKWYFGVALPELLKQLGYERHEDELVHRHLKITYFRVKPDKHGVHRESDIPSVFSNESDLKISQKKEFLDWFMRLAAQYGVYIPDPGER